MTWQTPLETSIKATNSYGLAKLDYNNQSKAVEIIGSGINHSQDEEHQDE